MQSALTPIIWVKEQFPGDDDVAESCNHHFTVLICSTISFRIFTYIKINHNLTSMISKGILPQLSQAMVIQKGNLIKSELEGLQVLLVQSCFFPTNFHNKKQKFYQDHKNKISLNFGFIELFSTDMNGINYGPFHIGMLIFE